MYAVPTRVLLLISNETAVRSPGLVIRPEEGLSVTCPQNRTVNQNREPVPSIPCTPFGPCIISTSRLPENIREEEHPRGA